MSIEVFSHPFVLIVIVQISDGIAATPTAGESYSLTCGTPGASGFTYQWTRASGSLRPSPTNAATLSFSPLRLSDAAQYTCEATLNSRMYTANFDVSVQGWHCIS